MPAPGSTPVEPTWSTCNWATPLITGVFTTNPPPVDYGINPATGTYCPPYRPSTGSVISPYEDYTVECGPFGFATRRCHNPDFAAGIAEAEGGLGAELPDCSRNWVYLGCVDTGAGEVGLWEGECPTCPFGTTLDPDDCLCYSGSGCAAGYCYCQLSGDCIPCTAPDCPDLYACYWNPATCTHECEGQPECADTERYDFDECACVTVCEDSCWCEAT